MFDWSNLERNNIISTLLELSPDVCGQEIDVETFHTLISKRIKKHFPVMVNVEWDKKVKSYGAFVGGAYYSSKDEVGRKCIEIVIHYNPLHDVIKLTKIRFHHICKNIADTLLHEVVHMRQYRRRSFKVLPDYNSTAASNKIREEQNYLGCTDEIDAYGFNIACELVDKFQGNHRKIIRYLDSNHRGEQQRGCSFRMYLKAFGHNHDHEIIKRVKKKVIRYLPRAEEGRPFKSSDWICY
jgi:hypothetical protein